MAGSRKVFFFSFSFFPNWSGLFWKGKGAALGAGYTFSENETVFVLGDAASCIHWQRGRGGLRGRVKKDEKVVCRDAGKGFIAGFVIGKLTG